MGSNKIVYSLRLTSEVVNELKKNKNNITINFSPTSKNDDHIIFGDGKRLRITKVPESQPVDLWKLSGKNNWEMVGSVNHRFCVHQAHASSSQSIAIRRETEMVENNRNARKLVTLDTLDYGLGEKRLRVTNPKQVSLGSSPSCLNGSVRSSTFKRSAPSLHSTRSPHINPTGVKDSANQSLSKIKHATKSISQPQTNLKASKIDNIKKPLVVSKSEKSLEDGEILEKSRQRENIIETWNSSKNSNPDSSFYKNPRHENFNLRTSEDFSQNNLKSRALSERSDSHQSWSPTNLDHAAYSFEAHSSSNQKRYNHATPIIERRTPETDSGLLINSVPSGMVQSIRSSANQLIEEFENRYAEYVDLSSIVDSRLSIFRNLEAELQCFPSNEAPSSLVFRVIVEERRLTEDINFCQSLERMEECCASLLLIKSRVRKLL